MGIKNGEIEIAQEGDHPADIMTRISHLSAFLEEMFSGAHVKPESDVVLSPMAVDGLALIHSSIAEAAKHASAIS